MLAGLAKRPAMKKQRTAGQALELQHLPDEDDVIAALVAVARLTFKTGGALLEQRHPAKTLTTLQARKFVGTPACEKLREFTLFECQDVHGEMRTGLECRAAQRLLVQGPQHERRIERDRVEGADGCANTLAAVPTRGDDGHSGGELPECIAKGSRIDHGSPLQISNDSFSKPKRTAPRLRP